MNHVCRPAHVNQYWSYTQLTEAPVQGAEHRACQDCMRTVHLWHILWFHAKCQTSLAVMKCWDRQTEWFRLGCLDFRQLDWCEVQLIK